MRVQCRNCFEVRGAVASCCPLAFGCLTRQLRGVVQGEPDIYDLMKRFGVKVGMTREEFLELMAMSAEAGACFAAAHCRRHKTRTRCR